MPRGVKRTINITEEIAAVDAKIQRHEKSIAELKSMRSQLEDQQYRQDTGRLMQAITMNGMTIDDAIEKLSIK